MTMPLAFTSGFDHFLGSEILLDVMVTKRSVTKADFQESVVSQTSLRKSC